jgi:hypothetical protein
MYHQALLVSCVQYDGLHVHDYAASAVLYCCRDVSSSMIVACVDLARQEQQQHWES